MAKSKITVVGAGNVGATTAHIAAMRDIGEIILIDIKEGLAEGKALDIAQSGGVFGFSSGITGTTDWGLAADSDLVIITSGMPRSPGMSRDDLLAKNVQIVKSVSKEVKEKCPRAFVIVVCNPLDAMVYTAAKITGFEKNKILGMAGALDSARFCCFVSRELGVSIEDVSCVLMGGHGDSMVPLPRFSSVAGISVSELIKPDRLEEIINRTRLGGIEIVNLLGYSAYYAPAAGAVKMAESILYDKKRLICSCVHCGDEYDAGGLFVGVPAIIGDKGVNKIVQLDLNKTESQQFQSSVEHVQKLTAKVEGIL